MKTIYVLKDFMSFKGITEEEANQGIKESMEAQNLLSIVETTKLS